MPLNHQQTMTLVDLLADRALRAGGAQYFSSLVGQANWPRPFKLERQAGWSGRLPQDALDLVQYADGQGINPADRQTTTLGSLLLPELPRLGVHEATTVVALIFSAGLISDAKALADLKMRYQVPEAEGAQPDVGYSRGPVFTWNGPEDSVELQGFFSREPDYLDVGFLIKAITKAASVCIVEVAATGAKGTGILIDTDLILTNYHVLAPSADVDAAEAARSAVFKFGVFSNAQLPVFELKAEALAPVVAKSPVGELDFILIRVQLIDGFVRAPLDFSTKLPAPRSALNLLHHPAGGDMKLSISNNGVTMSDRESGLLQYVTTAASGSSGSPCFDDSWQLVGIHHAEKSLAFGTVREGILMSNIYPIIKDMISSLPAT